MKTAEIEAFWIDFTFMEQTDLVNNKLQKFIKNHNKNNSKHWYLVNPFDYNINDAMDICNQNKHPYVFAYDDMWIGIPSVYTKEIVSNKTIVALYKQLNVQSVSESDSESD